MSRDQAALTGLAFGQYEAMAPDYDRHLLDDCSYQAPEVVARALAELRPEPGLWVEVGAGTGLVGRALARHAVPLRLLAVDISRAMLARVRDPDADAPSSIPEAAPSRYVGALQADGLASLPLAAGSCAGALAVGLLEHVINPAQLFAGLARVVGPGGAFVFTFCPNDSGRIEVFDHVGKLLSHDAALIEACLEACRFAEVDSVDYPAYVNGARWIAHRLVVATRTAG
jgi:SAM-dependent methyltransferase